MAEKNPVSPVMRVWFPPNLLKRREQKDPTKGEGKYGLTLCLNPAELDAQEKVLWADMVRAANECAVLKFKKTLGEFPDSFKKPFHSGKDKTEYGMTPADIYFNASSNYQPTIAGPDAKTIEEPLENYIYAGCYVRITTKPYSFDQDGGKGVGVGVFSVMFVRNGPKLNFRAKTEEDFAAYVVAPGQTATGGRELTDADLGL